MALSCDRSASARPSCFPPSYGMPELHRTVPNAHGHNNFPPVPSFLFHFVMDRDGCVPDKSERAQKGEALSGKIESPGEVRSEKRGVF